MRGFLDGLYRAALWMAALCLAAIGLMVGLQLAGRLIDGAMRLAGFVPYGFVILSLAEIAANLLAAASFLALAATLKRGAHIRVTMLLTHLDARQRRWAEAWALTAATGFSAYMTWSIGRFTYFSYVFNEVSPGVIPVPLAIPQAAMTVGVFILTIALVDELVMVLRGQPPSFRTAEEALTLGQEG
jgi:TRAP-type C4-dicarboxylate transport system permease small subunit